MKKKLSMGILVLVFILATGGISAATPSFSNASFETYTGDVSYPETYPDVYDDVALQSWSAVNSNGGRLDVFVSPGYNASDGNAALRVHPTIDGAWQTVGGFTIGQSYDLLFDMAATGIWKTTDNWSGWFNLSSAGQGVEVFLNDVSIGTAATDSRFSSNAVFGQDPFAYATYQLSFSAAAEELTFLFKVLDSDDSGGVALDNLRLVEHSDIPEPATVMLLGLGILIMAAAGRTRPGRPA